MHNATLFTTGSVTWRSHFQPCLVQDKPSDFSGELDWPSFTNHRVSYVSWVCGVDYQISTWIELWCEADRAFFLGNSFVLGWKQYHSSISWTSELRDLRKREKSKTGQSWKMWGREGATGEARGCWGCWSERLGFVEARGTGCWGIRLESRRW